jgi:hypothetical protein
MRAKIMIEREKADGMVQIAQEKAAQMPKRENSNATSK